MIWKSLFNPYPATFSSNLGLWKRCPYEIVPEHPLCRHFYTPPHNSGGVLWFHVGHPCVHPSVVRPSVCPSVFRFQMITWVNINRFSPNLVCALILWRFGIANGQISSIFLRSYLPETHPYFRFQTITWVNNKEFSPKLAVCIDIKEIWFGIANVQISSNFLQSYLPETRQYFRCLDYNLSK